MWWKRGQRLAYRKSKKTLIWVKISEKQIFSLGIYYKGLKKGNIFLLAKEGSALGGE